MSDSTLHIGALASNNVNNIVNEAGKYDEYKEKVKDLTKEIQTRKDTFEKMAEPLVYVCAVSYTHLEKRGKEYYGIGDAAFFEQDGIGYGQYRPGTGKADLLYHGQKCH